MEAQMRISILATTLTAVVMTVAPYGASAQEAPQFMQDTYPENALEGAWQEYQAVTDPEGALDAKTKELIGLAMAAQVTCEYCIYYHTKAAQQHGATEDEIKEALATAGLTLQWSTMLNGSQYDMDEWRQQVDAMFAGD
jgi:AhpD family alkylhydroperoxidase